MTRAGLGIRIPLKPASGIHRIADLLPAGAGAIRRVLPAALFVAPQRVTGFGPVAVSAVAVRVVTAGSAFD